MVDKKAKPFCCNLGGFGFYSLDKQIVFPLSDFCILQNHVNGKGIGRLQSKCLQLPRQTKEPYQIIGIANKTPLRIFDPITMKYGIVAFN